MGLDARSKAKFAADRLRATGHFVRVHKVSAYLTQVGEVGDFMVYSLKDEDGH